jgi:hypothetical protein
LSSFNASNVACLILLPLQVHNKKAIRRREKNRKISPAL